MGVTFAVIELQMLEDLRNGAVMRILSDTVTPPITFLLDEPIQDPQQLLWPGMADAVLLDHHRSLAGKQI